MTIVAVGGHLVLRAAVEDAHPKAGGDAGATNPLQID
jgi:hypothetical protein